MVKGEEEDERFKQVLTDPRFKTLRRKNRRIKVDSRFKGMFDKKFDGRCVVDKRGRRINRTAEKTLKKFYEVSDSDDQEDEDNEKDSNEEEGGESQEDSDGGDDTKTNGPESDEDESRASVDDNKQRVGKKNKAKDSLKQDEPVATTSKSSLKVKPHDKKVADLRGEHNDLVSSSSDEESSEEEEEEEEEDIEHEWGELDKDAPRGEETSNRLAVCNVDWDRIKAQDLYILFNSFKPASGEIISVKIYPSQFGKERMKEEAIKGPKELTEVTIDEEEDGSARASIKDDDKDIDDGDPMVLEKLRQYQINRLKYYYAVVECDTAETATSLYDHLDGMEYESSASTLDIRFIPDDVTFDDDEPSSECYEMPSLIDYKAPLFITTALQQSKVRLTWDETDPDRGRKFQKAFTDVDKAADDLAVYLASSSSEDDDENQLDEEDVSMDGVKSVKDKINKYKDLLKSIEKEDEDEKDIDMEVTWQPDLENIGKELIEKKKMEKMSVFEREKLEKKSKKGGKIENKVPRELKDSEEDVDEEEEQDAQNEYHEDSDDERNQSEQENDEAGKEALSLLVMDDEKDKKHFDYGDYIQDKKSKRKKKKNQSKIQEDNFKFDADDPRFAAIYQSHLYNVDQSSSHFKKTQAFEEILKRKARLDPEEKIPKRAKKESDSLSSLVERAKAKTSQVSKWKKS